MNAVSCGFVRWWRGVALAAVLVGPAAFGQVVVNETFDSYATDAEMLAVWVPTLGNGSALADFSEEFNGILTNDDTLFPGVEGQALDHVGALVSTGMVNQYGGVIDQATGLEPAFQVAPSPTQSVRVSVDLFDSGSGNERITLGLRHVDTSGGGVATENILELGLYNSAGTDNSDPPDPNFFAGPGHGYRVILFEGFDSPLTAQPNWQYFQLPAELDRDTDADSITTMADVGAGWHRYSALIEPDQVTLSIDLWRDGLRNTSRTPDAETGIRPGEEGLDATITWPVQISANGFNSLRLGGPSGLSSAGTGDTAFDNIVLELVDAEAAPGEIVIDVASGSLTQSQAGYASIDTATSLTKTGAGTVVFDAANAYAGPTTIEAGTLEVANGGALAATSVTVQAGGVLAVASGTTLQSPGVTLAGGTLSGESLTIAGSGGVGSLTVDAGTITGSPAVSVAAGGAMTLAAEARVDVSIGSLAIDEGAGGGLLDVGSGKVAIAAGGISATDLRADLIAGRNGGAWNGTAGIASAAAATSGGTREVGYVVNGDGSATVSFAAPGDADLSGQVNVFDLIGIDSAGKFGTGGASVWSEGDFNYDGITNVFDLIGIDSSGAYGAGDYLPSAPASAAAITAVPEPAAAWGLVAAAAGLLVSRRLAKKSI